LGAEEEIDMPVFFYIDPDIVNDLSMQNVTNITLSYTFFKTGDEKQDDVMMVDDKDAVVRNTSSVINKVSGALSE